MASMTKLSRNLALVCFRNPAVQRSSIHPGSFSYLQQSSSSLSSHLRQERGFSTTTVNSYWTKKNTAKELREKQYKERQEHKDEIKLRRDGKLKGTRKQQFHEWYIPKEERENLLDKQARQVGLEWRLEVAVVLERLPIVLPDKPKWGSDYENLKTYLDQFGREYPEALAGSMKIDEIEDLTDEAIVAKHSPRGFRSVPRETEEDYQCDVRTLNRRLKTWVYLTVKDTVKTWQGEKEMWRLPTVEVTSNETLLDAANRAIREKVGNGMNIWYPSNCPMTVDMRNFTEEEREQNGNLFGVKTFFMVSQYDDGIVTPDDLLVADFAWLEKKQLVKCIEENDGEAKAKLYFYLLNDICQYQIED